MDLNSMRLASLQHEPQRLLIEAGVLNGELESLVMDNYKLFVENLLFRKEDKNLSMKKFELNDELHGLSQQCSAFRDRVGHFVNSHKRNRKTLQHHMQLVELLEVPQLVDACARNGFYDEALELANFVNGLERRHLLITEVRSNNSIISNTSAANINVTSSQGCNIRTGSGVVQSIVDDVHSTLITLRATLLQLISQNNSLPKHIQFLSTLRKLDTLLVDREIGLETFLEINHNTNASTSHNINTTDGTYNKGIEPNKIDSLRQYMLQCAETKLQMDFLEVRTIWLQQLLDKALNDISVVVDYSDSSIMNISEFNIGSKSNATVVGLPGVYGRTIEMLETSRSAWFSIITQFNALFSDMKGSIPASSVISSWLIIMTNNLLEDIQSLLLQIEDGASVKAVLDQTLFFSDRMSQVGGDFSPYIFPMFCSTISRRISNEWISALANFKSILVTERMTIKVDGSDNEQIVPSFLPQNETVSMTLGTVLPTTPNLSSRSPRTVEDIPPPTQLLTLPPLAYLLNAYLTGLNFLRDCAIIDCYDMALETFEKNICEAFRFFVDMAPEIRQRGQKYTITDGLPNVTDSLATIEKSTNRSTSAPTNSGGNKQLITSTVKLDVLFSDSIMDILIPHLQQCFILLYPTGTVHIKAVFEKLTSQISDLFVSAGLRTLPVVIANIQTPDGGNLGKIVGSVPSVASKEGGGIKVAVPSTSRTSVASTTATTLVPASDHVVNVGKKVEDSVDFPDDW